MKIRENDEEEGCRTVCYSPARVVVYRLLAIAKKCRRREKLCVQVQGTDEYSSEIPRKSDDRCRINVSGNVLWHTNSTRSVRNPVAQLLSNGNFVVRDQDDSSPDKFLWQSFDYPCDSLLPGMKLGRDLVTGFNRFLTSWKSSDDPSPGTYTYEMDPHGYPQPFVLRDKSMKFFRYGPWNGVWFSGTPRSPDNDSVVHFVLTNKEMYYTYDVIDTPTRRTIDTDGFIQRFVWRKDTQIWAGLYTKPNDYCDSYAVCGSFGKCNTNNSPKYQCLEGLVPKSQKNWNEGVWSDGCIRIGPLNCSIDKGFTKYSNVKLPDTTSSWYNTTMTLEECKIKCLLDCSCTTYANLDVRSSGSGCLLWFRDLLDIKVLNGPGQDLYVRVSSDSGNNVELTSVNRPEGRIFDWLCEPMSIMKEQHRSLKLVESEELYLYKLCLYSGDTTRMEAWDNGGSPPHDEIRRAQLEGISRRNYQAAGVLLDNLKAANISAKICSSGEGDSTRIKPKFIF